MMKRMLFAFALLLSAPLVAETLEDLVVSKDITIPERAEYKNIVVLSGQVDLFGKTENLVILKGLVRIHDKGEVRQKMLVLGGTVERLPGSKIPDSPKPSFADRWKNFGENWIEKWKHRIEAPDDEEESDEVIAPPKNHWGKVFAFPFLLAIPLSILIVLFGFAMIFFTLAPKLADRSEDVLKTEPMFSLLWGAAAYLFFTPLIAVLTLSIVGIPLVPLVVFFAVLFILAGFFSASFATIASSR